MPKELKNKPNRTRCNCGMQLLINLYVDESDKNQEPLLVKTKIRFQGYEPKTYNLNSDHIIDCPGCGTRFDWKGNRVASEGWQEHPGTFCGHFFVKNKSMSLCKSEQKTSDGLLESDCRVKCTICKKRSEAERTPSLF